MSEMIEIAGLDAEEAEKKRVIDEQAEANRLQRESEPKKPQTVREYLQAFAWQVAHQDIPDELTMYYTADICGILDDAADKLVALAD